jgi:hypothetical protein
MTQIIAFAGKKQSGKNTACNFILALKIAELGISKSTRLSKKGEIEITDILNECIDGKAWFPFRPPYVDVANLFDNELGKFIKVYAFADKLKRLSVELLGLKEEWVFGTDEQKNTPTHITWDQIPNNIESSSNGPMTAREVLQFVGTDMFRGLDPSIWINACMRQIEQESPEIALISDVRFENEVHAIQDKGGFVIGLKRNPYKEADQHASETHIEKCLDICNLVIDNTNISIPEQNKQIYFAIKDLTNMTEVIGG